MHVTVLGASGKIGQRVVELALDRGYGVTALVHSRDPFIGQNKLFVQKGDVHNEDDIRMALKGSDAVISCLGSWGTPGRDVLTSAMKLVIPIMAEMKMKRIVTLTGIGVQNPEKPLGGGQKLLMKVLKPFPAGKVFADGEQHLRLLATSSLDWTTICAPVMNNFGSKKYTLSLVTGNPFATIHRQAVAAAMLDQLESTDFIRQAPVIHRT